MVHGKSRGRCTVAFHCVPSRFQNARQTAAATLSRARDIARSKGLHYVYTGNVHDCDGGSTWCPGCGKLLIERDWYELGEWNLEDGRCRSCGHEISGRFEDKRGDWGGRRLPVRLAV